MKETYVALENGKVFKADFEPKEGDTVMLRTSVPMKVKSILQKEEVESWNPKGEEVPTAIFKKDMKNLK